LVEEIKTLEQIEVEERPVAGGLAYTHAATVTERSIEDYLSKIESFACHVDEIIAWRVDTGGDLYNCLKARIYRDRAYPAYIPGMVGTVRRASIAYYLTEKKRFHINTVATPTGLELVSGSGTVSLEEGKLMPHIHVVVADHTGNAYGGHLFPGTIVKEYVEGFLIKLKGVRFERRYSEEIKSTKLRFIPET